MARQHPIRPRTMGASIADAINVKASKSLDDDLSYHTAAASYRNSKRSLRAQVVTMAFASPFISSSPLKKPTETQLRTLSQVLWSWACCNNCLNRDQCATQSCPSQRRTRLQRYFKYYAELTASYDPDPGLGGLPALQTHEDLIEIIRQLKLDPETTRVALATKIYGASGVRAPPVEDQERAINLAVKVMVMVNCCAERQSSGLLEHGAYQTPWRGENTFCQFIQDIFPKTDNPTINADESTPPMDMKSVLTARNLKKQIGLKIRPTDDIRRHLKLDRTEKTVDVYHHTGFLKEHLRLTKDKSPDMSVSDSLRLYVKSWQQGYLH